MKPGQAASAPSVCWISCAHAITRREDGEEKAALEPLVHTFMGHGS